MWLKACSNYKSVLNKVKPKQDKYSEVSVVLKKAKDALKEKTDELDKVKAKVAKLESDCQ